MARIYLPFEDVALRPTFGPMLPGTPHPILVGNPHLRGGPFVGLPGYGMEAAEAGTNLVVDPDFPDLTNWEDWSLEGGETIEVGPQFAMDQGEFLQGLHIDVDDAGDGQYQDITIVDTTDYVGSVWVYVISGLLNLLIDKGDTSTINVSSTKIREWERLELPFTSTGTSGVVVLRSAGAAAQGWFWMPDLHTGTYASPARVGAQPASCIYTPSPISETQTPWSALCVVTPDWAYDTTDPGPTMFSLYEDGSNYIQCYYSANEDKWKAYSTDGTPTSAGISSTHARGDKVHLAITCDGYNAYIYVNGIKSSAFVMRSIQPVNLVIGAFTITAGSPFNGIVDDFAFLEGAAIPEHRVQEIYRSFLRGVPLHGMVESLT